MKVKRKNNFVEQLTLIITLCKRYKIQCFKIRDTCIRQTMQFIRKSLQIRSGKTNYMLLFLRYCIKLRPKFIIHEFFAYSKHCHYYFVMNRLTVIKSRTQRKCLFSKLAFIKLTIAPRHTLV